LRRLPSVDVVACRLPSGLAVRRSPRVRSSSDPPRIARFWLAKDLPIGFVRGPMPEPTTLPPTERGATAPFAAAAALDRLDAAIASHRAVRHPLFDLLAERATTRAFRVFALQHQALVGHFTRYLEHMLLQAPSSEEKLWIAKVLVDEYGEGSDGLDHATLYRRFALAVGATREQCDAEQLDPAVVQFVRSHAELCRNGSFLAALGAVGPGHEWSIPRMFPPIVRGLERLAVDPEPCSYFALHLEQDVEHGAWLREALERLVGTQADAAEVERGALLSLDLRAAVWDAIQQRIESGNEARPTTGLRCAGLRADLRAHGL
jgi:pyrroloquinoline quinone (PQQ) biosynthesis protein C